MEGNGRKIRWEKHSNYWFGYRDYGDGYSFYLYYIFPVENGYIVEACNNTYGADRVAVKNKRCVKASVFKDLEKLMRDIENGNTLWLYTGHCSIVVKGMITKEEY